MRIEHIAIWTMDLERSRSFYEEYFGGAAGAKYHNPQTGFESYFIVFDSGARLEIMRAPGLDPERSGERRIGYSHLAFAVGSEDQVRQLTERLRAEGYTVVSEPRRTGDGYYESCVLDPDGNRVEITA